MSEKKHKREATDLPDMTKPFRELYDQFWKQAEGQWDQLLRNPQFLATMASGVEQSQNLLARMQQMTSPTLTAMNIPTRDDLEALNRRLEEISRQIGELSGKIDKLSSAKRPSPRKRAAQKQTTKRSGRKA